MAGVPAAKIVLGIPLYARSWSGDARPTAGGYASMVAQALSEPEVSYDYDFPAATPVLVSKSGGVSTQLWFDDADSLLRKIAAAGTLGPVSYTHLDVYKRQSAWTPPTAPTTRSGSP